jgi:hypothetical protein
MAHFATVIAAFANITNNLLGVLAAFAVVLELHLNLLAANGSLIISI